MSSPPPRPKVLDLKGKRYAAWQAAATPAERAAATAEVFAYGSRPQSVAEAAAEARISAERAAVLAAKAERADRTRAARLALDQKRKTARITTLHRTASVTKSARIAAAVKAEYARAGLPPDTPPKAPQKPTKSKSKRI